jgi:hypothetical protein
MWDELKERNILKLILIVRFTCAELDVGHPIITQRILCALENAGVMASRTKNHFR